MKKDHIQPAESGTKQLFSAHHKDGLTMEQRGALLLSVSGKDTDTEAQSSSPQVICKCTRIGCQTIRFTGAIE